MLAWVENKKSPDVSTRTLNFKSDYLFKDNFDATAALFGLNLNQINTSN
jgi:hypothetical protein